MMAATKKRSDMWTHFTLMVENNKKAKWRSGSDS